MMVSPVRRRAAQSESDTVRTVGNDGQETLPVSAAAAIRTLLNPRSIALIGASEDESKFSGQPLRNLLRAGYAGELYPVNRRGGKVLGIPAHTATEELPAGVDVGLVMVPAAQAVDAVDDLGRAGVPVAVVAVSGFAEVGSAEGSELQRRLASVGRARGIRILGPNCNGVYNTVGPLPLGYNYTHSLRLDPGRVGVVSHSGALLGGFVPLLQRYGHSISSFVSSGNEVDLDLLDILDYLVDDPATRVIALILDGISRGSVFRNLVGRARERNKPVVALKLGNSTQGMDATRAHSSRLAGSREVYDAVFAGEGIVNTPTLQTLAACCATLAEGRRPTHQGVVALSTSGAGAILLADALSDADLKPPRLATTTVDRMRPTAGFAQVLNPFDIGAAGQGTIGTNLRALATDPAAGSLVVYLTPVPTMAWRQALADSLVTVANEFPVLPILVVSPGGLSEAEGRTYGEAHIPVLGSLLDAVAAIRSLTFGADPYSPQTTDQKSRVTEPSPQAGLSAENLSEYESKRLLAQYGIALGREIFTRDVDEGLAAAQHLGYPVALKAVGAAITHKSEQRLVTLDIRDEHALRDQYGNLERRARGIHAAGFDGVLVAAMFGEGVDVMLGAVIDRHFGPLVLVGTGGVLAEFVADVATALAPIGPPEARQLLGRTKVDRLLSGYRGVPPHDREALVDQICRLSAAAQDLRHEVVAIDLNPVRVALAGDGAVALDALVIKETS